MCSEAGLVGKGAVSVMVCMEQGVASRPLSLDLYSFWNSPSACLGFPCRIQSKVDLNFFFF